MQDDYNQYKKQQFIKFINSILFAFPLVFNQNTLGKNTQVCV